MWNNIEGWLSNIESEELQKLAKDKKVLEIGSYCGKSTVCMSQTAKYILAVDPHDGITTSVPKNTLPIIIENIKNSLCSVNIVVGKIEDFGHTIKDESFDFVFVDGDHSYEACLRDIKLALRLVKDGDFIAVHDYLSPYQKHDGVKLALRNITQNIRKIDTLGIIQKGKL